MDEMGFYLDWILILRDCLTLFGEETEGELWLILK
jgi:hypothetical protein